MRRAAALVLACLAGCAVLTPTEVREQGKRSEFDSKNAPREAAACIARNAESYRPLGGVAGPFPAQWRDGKEAGTFEVLVRNPARLADVAVLAEVTPRASGSKIVIWVTPNIVYQDMGAAIASGC